MTDELPPGWATAQFGSLGDWHGGGTPSKAVSEYWQNGTVCWVSPKDMKRFLIDSTQDQITEKAIEESVTNRVPANSVLMVTRSGILEHSFPVAVNTVPVTMNQDLKAVAVRGVDPIYTRYYLQARAQDILRTCRKDGTTVPSLDTDRLAAYSVVVAPAAEQRRIVSKIDELFSHINEGEQALERVQKLVERYRQSVLKAAVTGELTREWREKNKDKLGSGGALLARILKARREAWEKAELEKMKVKGIRPGDDKWKQKYREPLPPDTTGLPELPEGWVWANVGQLCFVDTGATPMRGTAKYYEGGTIPWVTSSTVNSERILESAELITTAAINETNAKVFPAGSLIIALYGEGKTRGKISELGIDAATNQACAALLCGHLDNSVKSYLRSFFEKSYEVLRIQASGGVQPNLNLSILKQTPIALPSSSEAEQINQCLAERKSQAVWVAGELSLWHHRLIALRQAILKSAFKGELVAQDPTDESASVLLERIAAECSVDNTAPKRGRKKKSAA